MFTAFGITAFLLAFSGMGLVHAIKKSKIRDGNTEGFGIFIYGPITIVLGLLTIIFGLLSLFL